MHPDVAEIDALNNHARVHFRSIQSRNRNSLAEILHEDGDSLTYRGNHRVAIADIV